MDVLIVVVIVVLFLIAGRGFVSLLARLEF